MIHQYKNNGYNIVMDVNSGAVHVVDDMVYDMISTAEPSTKAGEKDQETGKEAGRAGGGRTMAGKKSKKPWTKCWNWSGKVSFSPRTFMRIILPTLRNAKRS